MIVGFAMRTYPYAYMSLIYIIVCARNMQRDGLTSTLQGAGLLLQALTGCDCPSP